MKTPENMTRVINRKRYSTSTGMHTRRALWALLITLAGTTTGVQAWPSLPIWARQ
jgi:hypothetical protein